MAVTYAQLAAGGAAFATFNSQTIQFEGESTVDTALVTDVVETALLGKVDETRRDLIVRIAGRPCFYDTAALATMFPYIAASPGATYPGNTAKPAVWLSNNNDQITVASCIVGKMPDLELGVTGPILGPMELWGLIPYGVDPTTANSYYTIGTGSYSEPAVPSSASLGQQEFFASWGSVTGFGSFQAQEKWTISHELQLDPVVIQGRTRGFRLGSYRVMAKCRPLGPTWAQVAAAAANQGSGSGGGSQLSAGAQSLLIGGGSGQNVSPVVTIANAMLKTAGYRFANKELRNGEIGFVSTLPVGVVASGSSTAMLQLA